MLKEELGWLPDLEVFEPFVEVISLDVLTFKFLLWRFFKWLTSFIVSLSFNFLLTFCDLLLHDFNDFCHDHLLLLCH